MQITITNLKTLYKDLPPSQEKAGMEGSHDRSGDPQGPISEDHRGRPGIPVFSSRTVRAHDA